MTAHRHAHLMAQYAQDAMETETPWERWEMELYGRFIPLQGPFAFQKCREYRRRKPKTIMIGDMEVPEPFREPLEFGQAYYYADITDGEICGQAEWEGDETDFRWLERGLIHLDEEAAITHAKALIRVSGGEA